MPPPTTSKEMHMQRQKQKVAWIGLGIMGSPMAENLIAAGYDVTGYTLEAAGLARLAARGGTAASSVAEAVEDADVICTMVPASPQVEAVVYGEDGVLAHARAGALLIDTSSITPQTSIDPARAAAAKGIRSWTHRCPAARKEPSRRCSRSWSAATPRTSRTPAPCWTCSARPSCAAARTARARRSRRRTS
ncbi:2-hydroxy-3-oxopropionate reductase [Actinacidiphila cocklensis]|uniref:2-hydroxy-3-oxopropionate reductase n=1 Tax=Actinacidiphila cocklensis TaxID=887465 RepID=A0A9W4GTT0_9ACTN|nr:2-hydroxy-3-oxopropionate reductase [Actinacidiphila cocklensis]